MRSEWRRRDLTIAGSLFGISMAFGGGSVLFPLERLVVELAAIGAFGWFATNGWHAKAGRSAVAAMAIMILTLVLIVAQIIPLPPALWQALPGRSLAAAVFASIHARDQWLSISLDPAATRASAYYFLVPLTVFVATMHLDRVGQHKLLAILVAFALINGLLVAAQAQGLQWLTPYVTSERPGTGLFANKNHCGVFLVVAMPAAALLSITSRRIRTMAMRRLTGAAIVAFLAITEFGCLSRAGLAFMPLGLIASALIIAPKQATRRQLVMSACAVVATLATVAIVLPKAQVVRQALIRFNAEDDDRQKFWPDVIIAARDLFPIGSGLGTFVPVYDTYERLNNVRATFTNHAHSDYLEVTMEAGLPGMALVVSFLLWFAATSYRRLVDNWWLKPGFGTMLTAIIGTAILLIHSGLDYPLRTLTGASVLALFAGLLASKAPFRGAVVA